MFFMRLLESVCVPHAQPSLEMTVVSHQARLPVILPILCFPPM